VSPLEIVVSPLEIVVSKVRSGVRSPCLLAGLSHDDDGRRMTSRHAVRSGKRYHHYISATSSQP
jgi:hypothetical protein